MKVVKILNSELDMMLVINRLQDSGLLRAHRQTGNYMQIYCPFHSNGQERKPSCGVLMHSETRNGKTYSQGFFHCFTCQTKKSLESAVDYILKDHGHTQSGVEWLKENIPGYSPRQHHEDFDFLFPEKAFGDLVTKYAVEYTMQSMLKKPELSYVSEEELQKYRFTVPYMYERKLTDELIDKFDVGYDANWIAPGRKSPTPCVTFPVRDKSGRTLFLVRRSIKGKLFNYPTGVTKPVYGIYELPPDCKTVVVCESCFNALTSWRYGKPAVALLGTGNSYQLQQLKELGVNNFILAFDPDEAGRNATKKLKKALRGIAFTWEFQGIPEGKDINDLTEDEFNQLEII